MTTWCCLYQWKRFISEIVENFATSLMYLYRSYTYNLFGLSRGSILFCQPASLS